MYLKVYPLLILFIIALSCNQKQEETEQEIPWNTEKSTQFNKDITIEEDLRIKMFIESRNWKTVKTGSGLRYYIYQHGTGIQAMPGMDAEVKFKIHLLDGTLCYQTDSLETEIFKIDHSEVESGVQEGIKKMRVGDRAKLIIPSHLGHGLTGDMNKIPPLNTIVVDLELISLVK